MATADIALFSRFIFLSFTQTEYTDKEREDFIALKELEKRGLTHITHQLLRLRGIFQDNFTHNLKSTADKMRQFLRNETVEDRIFNNWLIPLATYATLAEHLEIAWDTHELIKLGVRLMVSQNRKRRKTMTWATSGRWCNTWHRATCFLRMAIIKL